MAEKTLAKTSEKFNFKHAIYTALITIMVSLLIAYFSGLLDKWTAHKRSVTSEDIEAIKSNCPTLDYKIAIYTLYESECRECYTFAKEVKSEIEELGYQSVDIINVKHEAVEYPKHNGSFFISPVKGQKLALIYIEKERL